MEAKSRLGGYCCRPAETVAAQIGEAVEEGG